MVSTTKLLVLIIGILLIFGGMYIYLSKIEARSTNTNNSGNISPEMPTLPTIQKISPTTVLPKRSIYFELNTGSQTSCGETCRKAMATLTNTGEDTAHNVKVDLNIYNNIGENVYSTQESLGDIPGGKSKSDAVTINADCGSILSLYSKCRGHLPLTLKTDIIFDEGTQNFPDQQFGG
jgi:hypothetical protein